MLKYAHLEFFYNRLKINEYGGKSDNEAQPSIFPNFHFALLFIPVAKLAKVQVY
jgi:hypothetical protein